MLTPTLVKSKYAACLESKFLLFYASHLAHRPLKHTKLKFEVRVCPELLEKKREIVAKDEIVAKVGSEKKQFNPFLPFDRNLWVADLSPSHVLIFNKFCVIPEHLLIITREFVPQAATFCKQDFEAVEAVLRDLEEEAAFAFFNSSAAAGASQPHRHFQVVGTDGKGAIIEEAIKAVPVEAGKVFQLSCFGTFQHACIKLGAEQNHLDTFCLLKQELPTAEAAYNLIWNRHWMIMVPRRKEFTEDGVNSLNALAFAGYILVMQESLLHDLDVLSTLQQVTFPCN